MGRDGRSSAAASGFSDAVFIDGADLLQQRRRNAAPRKHGLRSSIRTHVRTHLRIPLHPRPLFTIVLLQIAQSFLIHTASHEPQPGGGPRGHDALRQQYSVTTAITKQETNTQKRHDARTAMSYTLVVWYGIVEFNVPLDTV